MASKVEISNRALQLLGARAIVDLDDDSVNARACNLAYDAIRRAELEENNWTFAIKRASLPEITPALGVDEYPHAYQKPADFLRLLPPDPSRNDDTVDWIIEGRNILTRDAAPLKIRYVADIEDVNLMPPLFRETISARMARDMAEQLTQSNQKKKDADAAYQDVISKAKKTNSIQKPPAPQADDRWVRVRQ